MKSLGENMQFVETVARVMEGLHATGGIVNAPKTLPIEFHSYNAIVSTTVELDPQTPKPGASNHQTQKSRLQP